MEKIIANEILTTIQESSNFIQKAIVDLKGTWPEETRRPCARLVGAAMTDMLDYVMAPIYNEHPELSPDWYREGPPLKLEVQHLKISKEARQVLLTAFEAAYEKAQSAAGRLSEVSDPLELAIYSRGFHQISVSLCRARVILLMAEIESDSTGDSAGVK
jgi:hypothetical protein